MNWLLASTLFSSTLRFEYVDKQIDTEVSGGLFISKQKDVVSQGWKALCSLQNKKSQGESEFSAVSLTKCFKRMMKYIASKLT